MDTPLTKIGVKSPFVKELEKSLYDDESDTAVQSMKDTAVELPDILDPTSGLSTYAATSAAV